MVLAEAENKIAYSYNKHFTIPIYVNKASITHALLVIQSTGPKAEEKLGTERQKVGKLKQLASHVRDIDKTV